LALDDKYDDIKKLIDAGKEKGYLTYDQVNDLIPHDVHSPEDLEDLLTTIGTQGIDVLESSKGPTTDLEKKFEEVEEGSDDVELDLTPGALEKTNDPVRMYLREMGTVPLLTREGEVEIAKRIERGQNRVLKALSRSPIVIRELLALGEDLEKGVRSIKELVTFDEEEITEEIVDKRLKEFLAKINALEKLYKKVMPFVEKMAAVNQKKRPRDYRRYRINLARAVVRTSIAVRNSVSPTMNASGSLTASIARLMGCARLTGRSRIWRSGPKRRAVKSSARNTRSNRARSAESWKSSKWKRACCSRNSSARSARSSRATWTPSTPSAS
jgi:RNA polymerase primary sigma factor